MNISQIGYWHILRVFFATILLSLLLVNCTSDKNKMVPAVQDTTITPITAITKLVLDSAFLVDFIEKNKIEDSSAERLLNFYISRNFQYAWFTENGLAEQTHTFWNLRNYYLRFNKDSSMFDKALDNKIQDITADSAYKISDGDKRLMEVKLTQHFFQYAQYAYAGKIDPKELQWHIPRKKLDPEALLDSLVKNKGGNVDDWEPVNQQYALMQKELKRYAAIEENGGWQLIKTSNKRNFKQGDKDSLLLKIKTILFSTGDLSAFDSTTRFDTMLVKAVKQAQSRYGLKQSGIVDSFFLSELNVPVRNRIQQILINMERMRWLPKTRNGTRLEANIPEFKLHIFEDHKEVYTMNIVVGKAGTSSVIFTDELKYIVFSPYWNIPYSITKNEIVPGMNRNSNYLASKNMEITGYNNGFPVVRQKPGGSNALGDVKFIFPNSYNIYFHDTPSKSLFNKEKRAFSHGCIRLGEPFKLAQYLLRNDTSWTDQKIKDAMALGEEKWVTLKKSTPVFITYFTSWVDHEGLIHFRDDIYGHDAKMGKMLFQQ